MVRVGMRWLESRSCLGSYYIGTDGKMDFIDVKLSMCALYGCMDAVSPRPWLTFWWVVYVCLLYPVCLH